MENISIAERLSEIVEKRYGCKITLISPGEASQFEGFSAALDRNPSAPLIFCGSRLFLMVRDQDSLKSIACIEDAHLIEIEDLEKICFLTDGLLSSVLMDASRDVSFFSEETGPMAKVLSFMDFKNAKTQNINFEDLTKSLFENNYAELAKTGTVIPLPGSSANFPDPLLLVGPAHVDFHQAAFDIHSKSGLFSFLPWSALSPKDIVDSAELFKLGDMTIFINDLSALPEREQHLIASFLNTASEDEKPKIIAAASTPATILVAEGRLIPELAFVFQEMDVPGARVH